MTVPQTLQCGPLDNALQALGEKHGLLSTVPTCSPGATADNRPASSGGDAVEETRAASHSALELLGVPDNLNPPRVAGGGSRHLPSQPLTLDPRAPKSPPRLVLQTSRVPLHQAEPLSIPAGVGQAFATHRTPASGGRERSTLEVRFCWLPGGPRNQSAQIPGARWNVRSK